MKKYLIVSLILLSACASPGIRTGPPPAPDKIYSKHELLSILKERNDAVRTIEGKLSSRVRNRGESKRSTELMLIKKPSHLRIDILSPFGSPVLTMATDGEDIDLQYHSKGRFFTGRTDDPGMAAILSSSLDVKEFVLLLAGGIPLINFDESKAAATWEEKGYRLSLQNDSARQDILFDEKGLYPLESVIYDLQERALLSVTMAKYKGVDGFDFPSEIDLSMPLEDYEMKVKYSRVALNENLGLELFSLIPPEGVSIEGLEGLNF